MYGGIVGAIERCRDGESVGCIKEWRERWSNGAM